MHNRLLANVLRLPKRLKPGRWPCELGKPIQAMDTTIIYRADSYLRGFVKDSTGLTVDEATDVIAWMSRNPQTL